MPKSTRLGALTALQAALLLLSGVAVWGQDCESTLAPSAVGEQFPGAALDHFACADGEFLVAVDVWHSIVLGTLQWKCSDGAASAFHPHNSNDELGVVVFDVAITEIQAKYVAEFYPNATFLGDAYVGGYDASSGVETFSLTGPFGADLVYTNASTSSSCPVGSYATGVFISYYSTETEIASIVFAVQLECAEPTETCSPYHVVPQSPGGDDNNTAIVIGGSVAAVVLTTIFVGLMVYMRRRHRLKASPPPRAWQASDNIPGIASRPPKPPATSDAASAGASAPPPPLNASAPPYPTREQFPVAPTGVQFPVAPAGVQFPIPPTGVQVPGAQTGVQFPATQPTR